MNYRRRLVALMTFLGGIYFFLEFILPAEVAGLKVDRYHEEITLAFMVVGSMALGLGLINLLAVHGSRIIFRRRGALNSLALLLGLFGMIGITIADWACTARDSARVKRIFVLRDFARIIGADLEAQRSPVDASQRLFKLEAAVGAALAEVHRNLEKAGANAAAENYQKIVSARENIADQEAQCGVLLAELRKKGPGPVTLMELAETLNRLAGRYGELLEAAYQNSRTKRIYGLFYDGLFVSLGAAMFSLLAFYMAAAAYRAFRVRSTESALMMTAAVLVMLGQIPFGLWLWKDLPEIRLWLLTVPNTAAFRGIAIGAAVAGLVMAFRMWLSIESESFSREGGDK